MAATKPLRLEKLSSAPPLTQQAGKVMLVRPYWVLYILAFFIPFQFELEISLLSGARFTPQTIGGIILFVFLVSACLPPKSKAGRLARTPHLAFFVIYLLVSIIAIAKGPNVNGAVQGSWAIYRIVIAAPILYIGIWMFIKSSARVRKVLTWLSLGATLGGAIAMIQTLSSGRLLSGLGSNYRYLGFLTPLPPEIIVGSSDGLEQGLYLSGTNIFRGHGTFYTANGFGVLLCVTFFITWGLLATTTPKKRWLWVIAMALQSGGLVATFSRSAWAAVGIGIFFMLMLQLYANQKITLTRSKLITASAIFVCFMIGLVIFPTDKIISHFISMLSPNEVSEFNWRKIVWEYSIERIQENPLFGLGTSIIYNSDANVPGSGKLTQFTSHNLWLDIGYQRGVVVLIIFILFTGYTFLSARKVLRQRKLRKQPEYGLMLGLTSGMVSFLISGIGSSSMQSENLSTLFWLIMVSIIILNHHVTLSHTQQGNLL